MKTAPVPPQILIVDDARDVREPIAIYMKRQGFRTRVAASAAEARKIMKETAIHLVLLDVMMPEEDGLSLCRELLETKGPPVILLTALMQEEDIIAGLNVGADDYITKPFSTEELLARVLAILRRVPPAHHRQGPFRRGFAGMIHDADQQKVLHPDGREVELTPGENRLLVAFLDHPNQMLTRARLLDLVRNREPAAYDRTVDNIVSRLRRKVGDISRPPSLILTEWGDGYRMATTVEIIT